MPSVSRLCPNDATHSRETTNGLAEVLTNAEAVNDWFGEDLPDGAEAAMSVESRKLPSTGHWSQGPLRVEMCLTRPALRGQLLPLATPTKPSFEQLVHPGNLPDALWKHLGQSGRWFLRRAQYQRACRNAQTREDCVAVPTLAVGEVFKSALQKSRIDASCPAFSCSWTELDQSSPPIRVSPYLCRSQPKY
jgi:hypothetical protein